MTVEMAEHDDWRMHQERFGDALIGLLEIGSFARGEAVSLSDHDMRLVVDIADPLLVLDELRWSDDGQDITLLDWRILQGASGYSYGFSNLAYIEASIEQGRFPLNDHTAIYQGAIRLDLDKRIAAFRAKYIGRRFDNLFGDFARQIDWRVNHRMTKELSALFQRLDRDKCSVPATQTGYRAMRDMAHLDSYRRTGLYCASAEEVDDYFSGQPKPIRDAFRRLWELKVIESERSQLFADLEAGNEARGREIDGLATQVAEAWRLFQKAVR